MTYSDPILVGSWSDTIIPKKVFIFSGNISQDITPDLICRYLLLFCTSCTIFYLGKSLVECTSSSQEHPISDPATRKFFSPFAEPLKSGERWRASPVVARGAFLPPLNLLVSTGKIAC